jgi:hypothetical protein
MRSPRRETVTDASGDNDDDEKSRKLFQWNRGRHFPQDSQTKQFVVKRVAVKLAQSKLKLQFALKLLSEGNFFGKLDTFDRCAIFCFYS